MLPVLLWEEMVVMRSIFTGCKLPHPLCKREPRAMRRQQSACWCYGKDWEPKRRVGKERAKVKASIRSGKKVCVCVCLSERTGGRWRVTLGWWRGKWKGQVAVIERGRGKQEEEDTMNEREKEWGWEPAKGGLHFRPTRDRFEPASAPIFQPQASRGDFIGVRVLVCLKINQ